ncbi:hypothetical protein N7535_007703 [Penicillium sp. DV-2018c]|nr:hypothetical protein N7461_003735 [Penicillium sp. DV-2018c]KAJ5566065.1 hypothetical protein N7535_007703 [Penicillium sp. DV-2018c]
MEFDLDPEVIAKRQTMAQLLDSNELLNILGRTDYIERIDDTSEIGERPDPENPHVHDMGSLSPLGFDMLQHVVEFLDLRSARQLSLVNRYAHALVDGSSVAFIKKWAPDMPKTLCHARIIEYWEVRQLKCAIRNTRCVSCGELSPEIWLATMERCCPPCMRFNQAYWCLSKTQTIAAFALPLEELNKIQPIFVVNLLEERTDQMISASGGFVYPIKRTLARALEIHGSIEAVKAAALEICAGRQDPRFPEVPEAALFAPSTYDHLRAARLEPLAWARTNNVGVTGFAGNWSVRGAPAIGMICAFSAPIVPHGHKQLITYGCRGCVAFMTHPHIFRLNDQEKTWLKISLSSTANEAYAEIYRRAFRIRTAGEMVEHIRSECLGGWSLIYKVRQGQMPPVEGPEALA